MVPIAGPARFSMIIMPEKFAILASFYQWPLLMLGTALELVIPLLAPILYAQQETGRIAEISQFVVEVTQLMELNVD